MWRYERGWEGVLSVARSVFLNMSVYLSCSFVTSLNFFFILFNFILFSSHFTFFIFSSLYIFFLIFQCYFPFSLPFLFYFPL